MRYGFCTGFASALKDRPDDPLLEAIRGAGYDYVEFPLTLIAALPQDGFERLRASLDRLSLAADCCCNMFPASIRLTGPARDPDAARAYLEKAFPRMKALGVGTLVFGSSGARNLPEGTGAREGCGQLSSLVREIVVPLLDQFGVTLAMEPIGSYEANFINTLPEAMEVVRRAGHPRVRLLADSVHMLYEREEPQHLRTYFPWLAHVHVCESGRALPSAGLSAGLERILGVLRELRYDGTLSFEPLPSSAEDMASALRLLREWFGGR